MNAIFDLRSPDGSEVREVAEAKQLVEVRDIPPN